MENEKLLVSKSEVQRLWKMADRWQEQNDNYTHDVGAGIKFALMSLGLDKEEAKS